LETASRQNEGETDGDANGTGETSTSGSGILAGEGKVVDTGKGKFGMDVKFVSLLGLMKRWTYAETL
jgi:hypothetical protein